MRVLDHLSKGKAWETALSLCKELQQEYESTNFDYARLADLLVLQAELYGAILKGDRRFGSYFRVAFYGTRFPLSISGKQFVYRATTVEGVEQFVQRMMDKHPDAQILQTSDIPRDEIHFADAQYLQITAVVPEPDPTTPMLANPEVPPYARIFFEQNHVNQFSFSRDFTKMSNAAPRSSTNDITTRWTEKTVSQCREPLDWLRLIFSAGLDLRGDIPDDFEAHGSARNPHHRVLSTCVDSTQSAGDMLIALDAQLRMPSTIFRRSTRPWQSSSVGTRMYCRLLATGRRSILRRFLLPSITSLTHLKALTSHSIARRSRHLSMSLPIQVKLVCSIDFIRISTDSCVSQSRTLTLATDLPLSQVLDLATCLKLHSLLCSRELLSFQESLERRET